MSYDLSKLSKPQRNRPLIMTFFSEAGIGKTSLAATFPNPVIIPIEDGTASLVGNDDVAIFPVPQTSDEVFDMIEGLATGEHDFKTLVIDSVTQFASMVEHEIVKNDPKAKSINQAGGGYGAGYGAAADVHAKLREWLGSLSTDRNMNIIFLGHADTETMNLPDQEEYNRYTVRLHKKCLPNYVDNVDLVGFLRLETFTRGDDDRKKAISTEKREIVCHPQAANVSKNRFGITEPIHFNLGENPFAEYLQKSKGKK